MRSISQAEIKIKGPTLCRRLGLPDTPKTLPPGYCPSVYRRNCTQFRGLFSSALIPSTPRARHFALAEQVQYATKARSQSVQVWNSVRPIHLFGRIRDHDSWFRLTSSTGFPQHAINRVAHWGRLSTAALRSSNVRNLRLGL
jgi:hypothetical protein